MITEKEYNIAVKEYSKNLYRYFLKTLRDDQSSKDLLQDVFLKLWSNKDKIDWGKRKTWLFSVAHNSMINFLRSEYKKRELGNGEMEKASSCCHSNMEDKEVIEKSLSSLAPIQKSIVLLRDLEGYNYHEIGEILQLSESQVKVYLFRARQKIKESIQNLTTVYEKRI